MDKKYLKLSNQALGAIMMALQKGLLAAQSGDKENADITSLLKDFDLEDTKEGLIVLNPPVVDYTIKEKE